MSNKRYRADRAPAAADLMPRTGLKTRKSYAVCIPVGLACAVLFVGMLVQAPKLAAARLEALGAGQAFVDSANNPAMHPLPMLNTHVAISITGTVADVVLTQTFRNDSQAWINVIYALPVTDTTIVYGWELTTDDRRIRGVVREREAAVRSYEIARTEGRQAALLEPLARDLFHVKVANIAPGATLTTELKLIHPVVQTGRSYRLQLPTTLAPRYQPLAQIETAYRNPYPANDSAISLVELPIRDLGMVRVTKPRYPLTWDIRLAAGTDLKYVNMPLHHTKIDRDAAGAHLTNSSRPAEMDRDLVLVWTLSDSAEPTASILTQHVGSEWFGMLELHEPTQVQQAKHQPRALILVIDVSGSMSGAAMRQAKEAARTAVAGLSASDVFNVIAFDHRVFQLFDRPESAYSANRETALNFIDDLRADGGTEMLPALGRAFEQSSSVSDVLAQVLFVTDGSVHTSGDLLALIDSELGAARLSTVGIGAAPNTAFMRRAAELGGGMFRQVSTMTEVKRVLEDLIHTLSQPMLTDISIDWPPGAEAAGDSLRDLYVGEPLRIPVRFADYPFGYSIVVSGRYMGAPWRVELPIGFRKDASPLEASMAIVWAGGKIRSFVDRAEFSAEASSTLRNDILPLALKYGVASPVTAFLAEELRPTRPSAQAAGNVTLAQQLPAQEFAYPQTATQLALFIYAALFSLFWLVMVLVLRRDDESHGQ